MTQSTDQVMVSREEMGRIQDWVGDVLKAMKPEDVKRLLTKEQLLQTKLLIFFHEFEKHQTPTIYKAKVHGQTREYQIISPCPGRKWIPAWDFVNRMQVSRRFSTLNDLSAFAEAFPQLAFGDCKIFAGGWKSDQKSGDLTPYDFLQLRDGEIISRTWKGLNAEYGYLAVRS